MIKYDEPITMIHLSEALCVSLRTATRLVAPLRKSLGLGKHKSLTKQQVLDYFGDRLIGRL